MEIGQKVQVVRIRDRVGRPTAAKLGKVGEIVDYKMTDGSTVGMMVKFADGAATWFFEDELKAV